MSLKVTYNSPAFGKGEEVAVNGLGVLVNGKSVDLDEAAERAFLAENGKTVKEALKDDPHFKVEGTAELKGAAASVPEVSDSTVPEEVND